MGISPGSKFSDVVEGSYISASKTVTTTESLAAVGGSNLSGREEIWIFNNGPKTIYYGPTGVTTSTGIPIETDESIVLQWGEDVNIYMITSVATSTVVIQELS